MSHRRAKEVRKEAKEFLLDRDERAKRKSPLPGGSAGTVSHFKPGHKSANSSHSDLDLVFDMMCVLKMKKIKINKSLLSSLQRMSLHKPGIPSCERKCVQKERHGLKQPCHTVTAGMHDNNVLSPRG